MIEQETSLPAGSEHYYYKKKRLTALLIGGCEYYCFTKVVVILPLPMSSVTTRFLPSNESIVPTSPSMLIVVAFVNAHVPSLLVLGSHCVPASSTWYVKSPLK